MKDFADSHDMDTDEYKQTVNKQLNDILSDSSVGVRVTDDSLKSILDDKRYLLVGDDVDELDKNTIGQVLDIEQEILFPETNVHSILAKGYWIEFEGDQDILDNLLEQVEEI